MYEDKKEVRVKALELALERLRGTISSEASAVVKDAEKFEKFILGEEKG